jgi:hypothetical protein
MTESTARSYAVRHVDRISGPGVEEGGRWCFDRVSMVVVVIKGGITRVIWLYLVNQVGRYMGIYFGTKLHVLLLGQQ